MSLHGFRLTQEAKDEGFSGGVFVASSQGHAFDVAEALGKTTDEQGNEWVSHDGVIYTDDDLFAQRLRDYPALEEIPTDELDPNAEPVQIPGITQQAQEAPAPVVGEPQGAQTLGTEIPAVHADEPGTEEEAIAVGEAVSGHSWGDSHDDEDDR